VTGTRRKICFVLPSLSGGGSERAAVQILNGLDEAAWDRSMYLFKREGPYVGDVSPGVRLDAGNDDSRTGRWQALRRFIATTRPDVVVSFLSYFTVLSAVKAAAVGARTVFNLQTPMSAFLSDGDYPWGHGWRRRVFSSVTRVGYASADLIITTSQGVADDLAERFGLARAAIRVVHNPVDVDTVTAAAAEPIDPAHADGWRHPVIVAAGRLAEAKNYPLLIDALALLRQRVPAQLFILGTGDEERSIRAQVSARSLESAVVLCGFQQNPWKYIARADVFALTSRYEGFGNVLVEAMACGVPVVATRSPGTIDIVRDGVDGLLVERHEPAAVAAALERALCDEPLRRSMADAARAGASRFAAPVIAGEYERVFRELAA
jgi:glycosyltransferase involved in cell wall biosynthesis